MIIEFTGLPGCGKTTIISEIKRIAKNEKRSILFAKEEILRNCRIGFFRHSRMLARLALDVILLFVFVANYAKYKDIFQQARYYVNASRQSFFQQLNLLRNILKKISMHHYCQRIHSSGNILIDEGICHTAFNIFVDSSSKSVPDHKIDSFLNIIPWPNVLVIVEASDDVIRERLLERGHRRIELDDERKYFNFMNDCSRVLKVLEEQHKCNTTVIFVRNEEPNKIEIIAQEILTAVSETPAPLSTCSGAINGA